MKHLSNIIYKKANRESYEDFLSYYDEQCDIYENKSSDEKQKPFHVRKLHIDLLMKRMKIKGKMIEPIVFLMKKALKNHFKNLHTGQVEKFKKCTKIYNDIELKTIKCDYIMNTGVSGTFMYDYERKTFILVHEKRNSYISNLYYLFKKMCKWGFVDFN